jgi:hypothetical protein
VSPCSSPLKQLHGWCYGLLYGVDQWDVQATIQRVNESLIDRGYITWFDLTNMKGNEILSCCVLSVPVNL